MPAEQEPNVISDLIDANNDLAVSAVQAISQLQAELLAAQEREKALRRLDEECETLERQGVLLKHGLIHLRAAVWELHPVLAASPSEKPGSEEEA